MARIQRKPFLATPSGIALLFISLPFLTVLINYFFASFCSFILDDWQVQENMIDHPLAYFIWGFVLFIFFIVICYEEDERAAEMRNEY